MNTCDMCLSLAGTPAENPPHEKLSASGISVFGNPQQELVKLNTQWKCDACGTWMYQATESGDPPNEWRMGDRPHDWPEE